MLPKRLHRLSYTGFGEISQERELRPLCISLHPGSSSQALPPKMSVLIVTNVWHRVIIPWTNHEDWTPPSVPRVKPSHPPPPRGRAQLGW
jgi:hypothetical protein